jgi:hypothetical protein
MNPDSWALVCVNTNVHEQVEVPIGEIGALPSAAGLWRASWLDQHDGPLSVPERMVFQPAEVIVIATV